MKSLIIVSLLALSTVSMAQSNPCTLTLKVKKEGAKSAKLDGISFSTKQIEALKTICTVKTDVMNVDEQVNDFKKTLEKRIAKLNAKSASEKAE